MIDLSQPILTNGTFTLRTMIMIVDEGKEAFRAGLKLRQCPRFKSPDMVRAWRDGWREAKHSTSRARISQ